MNVSVTKLSSEQRRWVERCAKRLKQLGPLFNHMDAVLLAFDLHRAWPGVDPTEAAEAYLAPEPWWLVSRQVHSSAANQRA